MGLLCEMPAPIATSSSIPASASITAYASIIATKTPAVSIIAYAFIDPSDSKYSSITRRLSCDTHLAVGDGLRPGYIPPSLLCRKMAGASEPKGFALR